LVQLLIKLASALQKLLLDIEGMNRSCGTVSLVTKYYIVVAIQPMKRLLKVELLNAFY